MNKYDIHKAIEELEYAMECDSPYIYDEAIKNYTLPLLKKLLEKSEKPIIRKKSEKPRMTVEQIIDKFVTPSTHRKSINLEVK